MGQAFAGVLLLGGATPLPEIATTATPQSAADLKDRRDRKYAQTPQLLVARGLWLTDEDCNVGRELLTAFYGTPHGLDHIV